MLRVGCHRESEFTGSSKQHKRVMVNPREPLLTGRLMRKSNTIGEMHLRKTADDRTETLEGAGKRSSSLGDFLSERNLIASDDYAGMQRARELVEASGIVSLLMETCTTINRIVGENIVDMHTFLPPEPILCCFIYVQDGTDYFMRLELQGSIPTLSFAERKCRDTYNIDFRPVDSSSRRYRARYDHCTAHA